MKKRMAYLIPVLLLLAYLVMTVWAEEPANGELPPVNFLPIVFNDGVLPATATPTWTPTPTATILPTETPTPTQTAVPTATIIERGNLLPLQLRIDTFAVGEGHSWRFDITLTETLTMTAITADNADLVLTLRDADNNLVLQQNNAPVGEAETIGSLTTPISGTFKVEITTADLSGAEYALMLHVDDSFGFIFRGLLQDGSAVTTTLPANREHFWFFTGSVGEVMTTTAVPDITTNIFLELYGPDAQRISPEFLDAADAGGEERYSYKFDQSGLHAIRVGEWDFNHGDYAITLRLETAPPDPDPILPAIPFNYSNITYPIHLATMYDNIPPDNPITDDGATLGRVLFYDTRLSANNQTACASCHFQDMGFSDSGASSVGFAGLTTRRTSMGLANLRYFQPDQFFWDTRADSLEDLILLPIQDHIEMGSTLDGVVAELSATSFYPTLFTNAFGTPEVTAERIAMAVSQFLRSMVSYQSKYDEGVPLNFSNFTAQEEFGRQLFEVSSLRCGLCHTTETQILLGPRNNGLDIVYEDNGLGEITGNPFDDGLFKPPTLRNIAVTGPYMHDGRFATLTEVIEHYSSGVQPHPNLDGFLPPGGFNLNATQKAALIAFLNTLTDNQFMTDEKFSDPFAAP